MADGRRAQLSSGVQQVGRAGRLAGRYFERGTPGTASPLHPGDPGGLWRFEPDSGGTVLVARAALKVAGEREAPPSPVRLSRDGRRWVSIESVLNRPLSISAALPRDYPTLSADALREALGELGEYDP